MTTPENSFGGFPGEDFSSGPDMDLDVAYAHEMAVNPGGIDVSGEALAYLDRQPRVEAALKAAAGVDDLDEAVMVYRMQRVTTRAERDAVVVLYTLDPSRLGLSYDEIMGFPLD